MFRKFVSFFVVLLPMCAIAAEIASYKEIPYYLRQLEASDLESKRIEINKIIHDAIVNADLSDKKTVKEMEPIIDKVRMAMDSKLDRPFLEGQSMWLASAVDYFESEKNRKNITLPKTDWLGAQTSSEKGGQISPYPNKILFMKDGKTKTVAESADIHEAVISSDERTVAFFRRSDEKSKAEIWAVHLKDLKRKRIAVVPSCATILLSLDGSSLFIQEMPSSPGKESAIDRVSTGGGSVKKIAQAVSLETIAAKGPFKGSLIVTKKSKHPMGLAEQECFYAMNESGKEIGRIKDVPCR